MTYQPAYHAPPRPAPPISGYAVTAFICSLLWGFGLLSLLAVGFGIAAMRQTGRGLRRGNGLATAGLVIGVLGLLPAAMWALGTFSG